MTACLESRWFVDFWTKPLRPEPLALFRILLGTTVFLCLVLSLAGSLDRYLGADGLCPADELDGWLEETGRFSLLLGPPRIPFLAPFLSDKQQAAWSAWGREFNTVRLMFGVWLGAVLCLTVGLGTRWAAFTAWVMSLSFHNRISWLLNGGDYLYRGGFFYLMLAPAGAAWSLDNWLLQRRPGLVPAWPVRLMQIQLCLVYLATGIVKLHEDWFRGEAVYWVLNDVSLTRWAYCQLPVPMFLCQLASWGTVLFELGFPVLIVFPQTRPWVLLAGLGLHGNIWLTTEVGWFSPVTLCWYALFLSPTAAELGLRILTARVWFHPK